MEVQLTKEESLLIITKMIRQSKYNVQQSSFHLLLWGWVTTLAYLGQYLLTVYSDFARPEMVWMVCIPAGIVSGIYGYRFRSKAVITTHLDYIYGNVWLGFLLPFLAILFFGSKIGYENITGMILMLAGSAVFISSRLLKHFPTLLGAIILWTAAFLSLTYNTEVQYLFGAMGTLFGYLMPGYFLRKKEQHD